jgi:cyanate permease
VWTVAILVNPCLYFSVNWLPTYFAQQRGMALGSQMGVFLTAIYIGLDLGNLACGALVMWLTRRGHSVQRAQRVVFLWATVLIAPCAAVSLIENLQNAVIALVVVNFGIGMWIANYLTMAQSVSRVHVSTAAGLLGGSGSLVGAVAMWAVGRVTKQTASFTVPMISVVAACIIACVAGWAVTRESVPARQEEVTHGSS